MSSAFDVCIRGSGVVGRTLALLLARERLKVALVDYGFWGQSPNSPSLRLAPRGTLQGTAAKLVSDPNNHDPNNHLDVRAYALNGASKQLLEGLRGWPEGIATTPVLAMQIWHGEGSEPELDFTAQNAAGQALAWIVDVPALEQQLANAISFQPQIEVVQAPVKAALQVVCEGQKSISRNEFGATWTVKPYAQKAIAARLESSQTHHGVAMQWFKNGEILALLPISGPDGNSVALVWSVSNERADALQKLSSDEFCAALQSACGDKPGHLRLTSERASWPLALSSADRWVGPGWALAGDAAHTVHPLAGQGLNLGLADALALAGVIAKREYWRGLGDEKLLRRYERVRKADVAAIGLVTDQLHGLFAQTDARWQGLREWGLRSFSRSGRLKTWVMRQAAGL